MKTVCRIKKGWGDEGKEGIVLGFSVKSRDGIMWTPILWNDEEDPDFHKERGLDFYTYPELKDKK